MLARDRIRAALDALAAGRLPDPSDRLALLASVQRAEHGLSWTAATGRTGTLAKAERNDAIRRAGRILDPTGSTPWRTARRIRDLLLRLMRRHPARAPADDAEAALIDAITAADGAPPVSTRQICRILTFSRDG